MKRPYSSFRSLYLSLLFFFLSFIFIQSLAAQSLKTDNPRIRLVPPGLDVTAGYVILENVTDKTINIVGAESPDFSHIELHRSMNKDGIMSMVEQDKFEIPPGEKFILKPGDYHLMMFKPKRQLKRNDTVKVVLIFNDGNKQEITFTVRKLSAMSMMKDMKGMKGGNKMKKENGM